MPGRRWTKEEIEYVKSHFIEQSCPEMAVVIGRTTRAVRHLFNNLGLKRPEPQIDDEFGRLTIIGKKYLVRRHGQQIGMVRVRCKCGVEKDVKLAAMVSGNTASCGCLIAEKAAERAGKLCSSHGLSGHPLYGQYYGMVARCKHKSQSSYKNYGGRGISVCEEWTYSFKAFYDWAMSAGWEKGLTIDRIDKNGNYQPDNCRFATMLEQANNKRGNRLVSAFGETKTIADWSRDSRCLVSYDMLRTRVVELGWDVPRALSTLPKKRVGNRYVIPKKFSRNQNLITHGMSGTRLYGRWNSMRSRCYNKKNNRYHVYGGKGVRVCKEWSSFTNFLSWAKANGYSPELQLDRIDTSGHYEPSNCRWVDRLGQANNRGSNHLVSAFGETKTATEWDRDCRCVVSYNCLLTRLNILKWSAEDAISKPARIRRL